jgi:hypothetical protein
MKHIPDGGSFFDTQHHGQHRDFGFHGSIAGNAPTVGPKHVAEPMGPGGGDYTKGGTVARGGSPPFAGSEPTAGSKHVPEPMDAGGGDYAHGGHVHPHGGHIVDVEARQDGGKVCHMSHGGMTIHHPDGHVTHHTHDGRQIHGSEHFAHGGGSEHHIHPHGHNVMHVEQMADGRIIHHHDHGGHTVHHRDGRVTHHYADGTPAAHGGHMSGIEGMHDESEYAHRARGGHMDAAEDKAMIEKAFSQHDAHMHHGEHENLHLARGGNVPLPRGMKPKVAHHRSPIGSAMPVNRAPRNPRNTPSAPGEMPGGEMGYGVQPGSEPDMAGSEQGIPNLKRGGRAR